MPKKPTEKPEFRTCIKNLLNSREILKKYIYPET